MKSKLHGIFGAVALLCITTFWLSTVGSELFLSQASVTAVKNAVLTGMWLLIPAMAATGGSGFSLAKGRGGRLVGVKPLKEAVRNARSPSEVHQRLDEYLAGGLRGGSYEAEEATA